MSTSRTKRVLLSICAAVLLSLPVSLSTSSMALAAPLAPLAQCEDTTCH